MKIWIVCTGEDPALWPERCDAAGFESAARKIQETLNAPAGGKKLNAEGCAVLCAPTECARMTAAACISGGEMRAEPLLKPVELCSFQERGIHSVKLWKEMARLQRAFGNPRQPESKKQLLCRAEELIGKLCRENQNVVLVADCLLTEALLDRLRAHGCDVSRSELFRLKPWERILITDRSLRCGGCQNNCLLANPGCARGLDKARRMKG